MAYYKTNRSYSNVETGESFDLWMDSEKHSYKLISPGSERHSEGTEVNGFYLSAHSPMTIKTNGNKQVKLNTGEFYNTKEGETITHRKFAGFSRFSKL